MAESAVIRERSGTGNEGDAVKGQAAVRGFVRPVEERIAPPSAPLVDAAELARRLGIERSWVYAHASELGALRLGRGPRARLRFDFEIVIARMRIAMESDDRGPKARQRRSPAHEPGPDLLPIKERGELTADVGSARGTRVPRKPSGQVLEFERADGRTFALRFRAYGERRYVTLGSVADGWTRANAERELANVLADVRRGIWRPTTSPAAKAPVDPTFHEFASEWLESRRHEFAPRTVEDYELALTHHLLPFFADYRLARDHGPGGRPLQGGEGPRARAGSGRAAALEPDDQQDADPARPDPRRRGPLRADRQQSGEDGGREAEGGGADGAPVSAGEQVQVLLRAAGSNRALLATAIMAGGLRVSGADASAVARHRPSAMAHSASPHRRQRRAFARSRSIPSWCSSFASTRSRRPVEPAG